MITSGDCAIGSSGVNTSKLLDQLTKEAARWMVLNVAHTIEESFLFTKSQWMSDKRHSGIKRSVLRVPHCTRIQTYIYTYIRTTNTHTHSHTHIWNVRMHAYTAPPHSTKSLCERRNRAHWKNYGHCELNECIQWRQLRPILLVPILGARSLVAFGSLEARRSMSLMYTNYTHWKLKKKNRCEMGFASSHTSSVIFFFLYVSAVWKIVQPVVACVIGILAMARMVCLQCLLVVSTRIWAGHRTIAFEHRSVAWPRWHTNT